MRNRLLIIGSMYVLLLSALGCRSDKTDIISALPEDRQALIEKAVSETPTLEKDNNTDSALQVIEFAKSAEKSDTC